MPKDPTPHGGEVMHPLPDRAKIPTGDDDAARSTGSQTSEAPDRPSLPTEPRPMAADVLGDGQQTDDSRNVDDDKPSVTRQPA